VGDYLAVGELDQNLIIGTLRAARINKAYYRKGKQGGIHSILAIFSIKTVPSRGSVLTI
jgi:hypothetical protein